MSGELIRSRDRGWYAIQICDQWHKTLSGIFRMGELLAEAKAELPHGEFGQMVATDLPFGDRSARMLMAIARDQRLRDRNHGSVLPVSWRTLYTLTTLTDEQFARVEPHLTPELGRTELVRLVKPPAVVGHLPPPRGKYSTIVIDPPWDLGAVIRGFGNLVAPQYPTMTEDEISDESAPWHPAGYAAEDAHLYLWTTHSHLPLALRVAEAWGFKYQCQLTWVKSVGFTRGCTRQSMSSSATAVV